MEHWGKRRILNGAEFNVGWRLAKAQSNLRKHRVDFFEAATILDDPHVRSEDQDEGGELREKLVGRSNTGRLLAVAVFIGWQSDDGEAEEMGFIRIISARPATHAEVALYDAS